MKCKRIGSAVLSIALIAQAFAAMPALPAAAAAGKSSSLTEFAAKVREITAADSEKDLFTQIVYDKNAGTLSADGGAAKTEIGALTVRSGRLMLKTGRNSLTGGNSATDGGYMLFDDAAAENGYTVSESDGLLTVTNEYQTARLIVKAAGSIPQYGAKTAAEGYNDLHILQYETPAEAYAAYLKYQTLPAVEYVQPSHYITLDAQDIVQSKAYTESLVNADGKSYNTWGEPLIGTEDFIAEYLNKEVLPEVVVAVIDTGLNTKPALFEGRIAEGALNISNSGDDSANDDLYHGTHISGTICELTPPNVKVLPVKVFNNEGKASDEQIYLGLMYALEQNADILNMSFNGLGVSPLEAEAMSIADAHGIICCAAAGNDTDDAGFYYPGSIESCITVGAVDQQMEHAEFSNTGKSLDIVAPGVGIISYGIGSADKKESKNGTSMATPHASACCALLRCYDKTIAPKRAEALLRVNAVDLGDPGFDEEYGWGFLNMKDFRWDDGICPAPEFSVESGNYGTAQTVALSTDIEGAEIRYTTDGSEPTAESLLYTEPIVIQETTWLRAVTVCKGWITSVESEAVYMIGGADRSGAYTVENGVLIRYSGVREKLVVPSVYNGEPIKAIAAAAFSDNHFLKEVSLPDTLTELPDYAFSNCPNLERVSALNIKKIGNYAFCNDRSLTAPEFSDTVETLGEAAFRECTALKEIAFSGVTELPESLCEQCYALETASFPAATVLHDNVFSECTALTEIGIPWENVTEIGNSALSMCPIWQGDLSLISLKKLGDSVFAGDSSLLRVSLPETITELPASTFRGCAGLRLLLLPGITKIAQGALATESGYSGLQTDLHYDRITAVEEGAFSGFAIGNGYETVDFSALETLNYHAFTGAMAGALRFPKITEVPEKAFEFSEIMCVYLENVQKLDVHSLHGVRAAALSTKVTDAADYALPEDLYVLAEAELPWLSQVRTSYQLCTDPLILRSSKELTLKQHETGKIYVLAGGIGLHYQWYLVSGEERTPVSGATEAAIVPDTHEKGTFTYLCVIICKNGETEEVSVELTVTDPATYTEIETDKLYYTSGTGSRFWQFTPESDGIYRLFTEGAAEAAGILSKTDGSRIAELQNLSAGGAALSVQLKAGETCCIETAGLWSSSYALMLTAKPLPETLISDCTVRVTARTASDYGSGYLPSVTVRSPEGKILNENVDYILSISEHNQYDRIGIYGIGSYTGYTETTVSMTVHIPEDTPVPVTLDSAADTAVYAFIPKTGGTYYYYATPAAGYAAEYDAYNRAGKFVSGSKYVNIRTKAVVADTPDGTETVFDENDSSPVTGYYFNSSLTMNAGQTYYFICTAKTAAEYTLVISQQQHDIRKASVTGSFSGTYEPGSFVKPSVKVKLGDLLLTEGVDYQRVDKNADLPGTATVTIHGMGLYYGQIERTFEIVYTAPDQPEGYIKEDNPVRVTCSDDRITTLWFQVEAGASPNAVTRYRILNNRVSGGKMQYQLFRYLPDSDLCIHLKPSDNATGDYSLKNGIYCITVSRVFADLASTAEITVLRPYSLEDAVLTITDQPYTGNPVASPVRVTAADGTVLKEDRDYFLLYTDTNADIMFGTQRVTVRATDRSYGYQNCTFNIYVDLPEDAPELSVGSHEVTVTLQDRLAVYRVCPQTDTSYMLATSDVADIVLRVFSPEAELLQQDHGDSTKSVSFDVPAGETRYLMLKFNAKKRQGTIHFMLETTMQMLSACTVSAEPQIYTGEPIAPHITFTDGDYTLVEGTDYRLRYTADDVNVGSATANYVGLGKYFGVCDVSYDIILPTLDDVLQLAPHPLLLNEMYVIKDFEEDYPAFRFTPGLDTELKIEVIDAECRVTMQLYADDGTFLASTAFRPDGALETAVQAGKTVYIVISPTDVSSTNRSFRITLTDTANNLKTVEDKDSGVFYRIAEDGSYAEAYYTDPECERLILHPEIGGVPVSYFPEALFSDLPPETVVIGFDGCNAADYADIYHFIYQQPKPDTAPTLSGDVNGNGKVSAADAVLLAAFLNENDAVDPDMFDITLADLNADGILDLSDLLELMRRI